MLSDYIPEKVLSNEGKIALGSAYQKRKLVSVSPGESIPF